MRAEIVHMVVLDVGAELALSRITDILGVPTENSPLLSRSPRPRYAGYPPPMQADVTEAVVDNERDGLRVQVRVHAVGAVAVRVRAPVEVDTLADLPLLATKVRLDGQQLEAAALAIGQRVAEALGPAMLEPYGTTAEPEEYRVYCLTEGAPAPAQLMAEDRRLVTALVLGEEEPHRIDDTLVQSVLRHTVRYYTDDLVVVGWENALLASPAGTYEDVLGVMELANLELLELRTYDALLDARLTNAFDDLDRLWRPGGVFRSARAALSDISELRVDFARLTDNLRDTGKFFGDWYLAKLHEKLRDRFHIDDWEGAVAEKMGTLEDMFHLAGEETNHRRAVVLEVMIVLLFVLDLVAIFVIGK